MNQSLALGIMLSGRSVFLTGAAGSGKTHTLNTFIRLAKKQKKKLAVTATTGLAATHLGGNTIHSWSGLGIYDDLPPNFFYKLPKSRRERIENTDVLIIDEISMLHDFRLDLIDLICQKVRDNSQPFGGLQVILAGDFFQLPPINREGSKQGGFAYNAKSWQDLNPTICYLTDQHRQDDQEYLAILEALRSNDLRRHHAEALFSRINTHLDSENIAELHTTNFNVDTINHSRLEQLDAEERTYTMTTTGSQSYVDNLKRACLAPETLRLKTGALVMALKNHQGQKYSNGSIGIVDSFEEYTGYPVIKFNNGHTVTMAEDTWELRDSDKKRAGLTQIPLRLAWAITVHKSQGMTLDAARIDLRRAFEPGMGYVALSRVKSLSALSLVGLNKMAVTVSEQALHIDESFHASSKAATKTLSHLKIDLEKEEAKPKKAKFSRSDPDKAARAEAWQERITNLRKTVPQANMPWTLAESEELIERSLEGQSIADLCTHFGRKPNAIMLRLNLSLAADLFTEELITTHRKLTKTNPTEAADLLSTLKLQIK